MIRNLLSFLILNSGSYKLLRINKSEFITVLCFHRVTDQPDKIWSPVRIADFHKIILFCKKNYEVVLPHQWNEKTTRPKLMITFDDGFGDFMDHALPLLSAAKIPCLHNVVIDSVVNNKPNWTFRINQVIAHHLKYKQKLSLREFDISFDRLINESNCSSASVQLMLLLKDLSISEIEIILEHFEFSGKSEMQFPKMMNEKDLIQCETEGVQIGSHGFTHILLNDYRSEMELNHEIADSKKMLESMLHHEISSFAFPAGMHGERLKEYAFQAGYQFLFIVDDMLCPISFLVPESIVFPRIIIPTLGSNEALLKIEGFHSGLKKWRTA